MTLPRLTLALCSLFLITASAFAQQPARRNSVSIFVVTNSNAGGAKIDAAYGASFDRMFGDRFSAELAVGSERSRRFIPAFGPRPQISGTVTDRLHPIDARISYHFFTSRRWTPYLSGGLRYVSDTVPTVEAPGFVRQIAVHTIDPEVSGGIALQFNPRFALRLDLTQVLGSHRANVADPEFKASVGLTFSF